MTGAARIRLWARLPFFLCLPLLLGSCVERWLQVRSDPSGALVFLDGQEIGRTPLKIPFDHYGTREVLLWVDPEDTPAEVDYQMVAQNLELKAPWYQWFPLDLFFEQLWPGTIVDSWEFDIRMPRITAESNLEQFLEEAKAQGIEVSADEKP